MDCGICSRCPGFPTDVDFYGKAVHPAGCFSRNFFWHQELAIKFVKNVVLICVTSAKDVRRGPQTPFVLTDLGGGDVERVLLGSGVVGRCPLR